MGSKLYRHVFVMSRGHHGNVFNDAYVICFYFLYKSICCRYSTDLNRLDMSKYSNA